MIALLPVPLAVKATIAEPLPPVAEVSDGASGTMPATNDADADEAALSPTALVATTVQVYVFAAVRDPTVIGELAPDADWVVPPSLDVQVAV